MTAREPATGRTAMDAREEKLFGRWLKAAERSVGRLAAALSGTWDFPPGWFRDKLAARMFGRMLGERTGREGCGVPVPFGDVRKAALSAGMDVTDLRFASELLEDLLVVNMEHGKYVVQDAGDRGCRCELYGAGVSREAGVPRTVRLAPDAFLRFLEAFDAAVPRIHAAADEVEREAGRRVRSDEILRTSVEKVASEVLGSRGIAYGFELTDGGIEFELRPAGGGTVRARIPLDGYPDRIRELPDLVAGPAGGSASGEWHV